jgi:predicted acetyltransferase
VGARAGRRRGYATEILRQSLVIARSYGLDRVLLTCDHDNVGSAAVTEACGGVLERVVPSDEADDGVPFRRYWIS